MHDLTRSLLERLWKGAPTFQEIDRRLEIECRRMSPTVAAVIGKDLIQRKQSLYRKDFKLAAFLASGGTAGNDGFLDFADCVSILPEERYQRLVENPDGFIDDEVSSTFEEYNFVSRVSEVCESALSEEKSDLLFYLVLGTGDIDCDEINAHDEDEAKRHMPRLYAKYKHLFAPSEIQTSDVMEDLDVVTLEDFFSGIPIDSLFKSQSDT